MTVLDSHYYSMYDLTSWLVKKMKCQTFGQVKYIRNPFKDYTNAERTGLFMNFNLLDTIPQ